MLLAESSEGKRVTRMLNTAADTTQILKEQKLDLPKKNVTVIGKIYINGKALTRSRHNQILTMSRWTQIRPPKWFAA